MAFTNAMLDLQGKTVDIGVWVQWYAFDAIGAITFGKTFGFMDKREDVHNVISGIEGGLHYAGIVGQVPLLHRFLLGNVALRKIMTRFVSDPVQIVTEVRARNRFKRSEEISMANLKAQMVLDSINEYDMGLTDAKERTDFLAFLRQQQRSTGTSMGTRELMNHLMNNL